MATAERTRDHEKIRHWAEQRGGIPTIVKGTGGMLRIDFVEGAKSGGRDEDLRKTDWDNWFEIFDRSDVDFLYSPEPGSKFFKLVDSDDDG